MSYNQLQAQVDEFLATFHDHDGFADVVSTITRLLMTGIHASVDSPNNPINTYAQDEDSHHIMARLQQHVRTGLSNNQHGNLVVSFFHPGGIYYDMLNELMDTYWDYADTLRDHNNQNNQNNQDNQNNQYNNENQNVQH